MNSSASGRRFFLKQTSQGCAALLLAPTLLQAQQAVATGKRVGMIGLDTSHSTAFVKALNAPDANPSYLGYKVVAAYPQGSKDIESSTSRVPAYTEEVKKLNVEIVSSISDLLKKVDVVLLETNDGRLHLEQALQVLKAGKRVFIDKPIAASLPEAIAIFEASKKYNIPLFSASSLRHIKGIENVTKSQVVGADTFSPAVLEKTHPDFFWYGIHGVETLYTVMGTGCQQVVRVHTDGTDIIVGTWADGRIGTVRGTRTGKHDYGGTVFTQTGNLILGPYGGYEPLLHDIIKYYETGEVPVTPAETIEIFAFMEAADESKRRGGSAVTLEHIMAIAKK
ncbi:MULTISPECIES: Gfo/Idh/MocA family oxidoreductase [unclassified Spirosoma]|uniref:Gfo/Idh/MocA family protein n=1 Tax=unclassified Spirosoma TaxID=2621999 RepID=UPI000966672F|nr:MULTISPECIES: Gfo/Idh/MocA family oxidoreductase [unclassified Spirosoma]MBN8826650.1 Gfo/Idh/MocA family oxidoreductase [Spirosoma sp.]OJW74487.1 MAG: dehydrogenase [Spirosoma sp. 48-14]